MVEFLITPRCEASMNFRVIKLYDTFINVVRSCESDCILLGQLMEDNSVDYQGERLLLKIVRYRESPGWLLNFHTNREQARILKLFSNKER